MSNAGCKAVYMGVESGSQRILDFLNKNITVAQIEEAINLCKKYNIRVYCSLIVGVPTETYEDYQLTKKLIEKLEPFSFAFNVFVGIPDSDLYRYILENDLFEYVDNLGLLYLPGYDIKARYFYGVDSKALVDYDFKQRTDFDVALLAKLGKHNSKSASFKTSAANFAKRTCCRLSTAARNRSK